MKNLFLIIFTALAVSGFAQKPAALKKRGAIIRTKKIVMKYKGNGLPDSLLIPVISGKYPQLQKALSENSLFYGDKAAKVVKQYKKDGTGITGLSYEVTYESRRIISLVLRYETMGAHPDTYQTWYTLDKITGNAYPIDNEITQVGQLAIFNK